MKLTFNDIITRSLWACVFLAALLVVIGGGVTL